MRIHALLYLIYRSYYTLLIIYLFYPCLLIRTSLLSNLPPGTMNLFHSSLIFFFLPFPLYTPHFPGPSSLVSGGHLSSRGRWSARSGVGIGVSAVPSVVSPPLSHSGTSPRRPVGDLGVFIFTWTPPRLTCPAVCLGERGILRDR